MTEPNAPERELLPPSPLCCLKFNPKSHETLVGGSYNGLVTYYDLRKPGAGPAETSQIEHSHHDPVYDIFWIASKTGSKCASVSTDGLMLWWDVRKLSEPEDSVQLTDKQIEGTVLGGSSMEYNSEAGANKYLVGTEQGMPVKIDLKARKPPAASGVAIYDAGVARHHGPIYTIQRNLLHTKFFLTVGDWTARVWAEDNTKSPIMTTKYHDAYLTSGAWSPTRAGVFFVTRNDGVMDVWDYFHDQKEITYTFKVGDDPLSSIAVEGTTGKYVAVGDEAGTVSLVELSRPLYEPTPGEKAAVGLMMEREAKGEKNLELRERDMRRAKAAEKKNASGADEVAPGGRDEAMEELLRKVDADFLAKIRDVEDDEAKNSDPAPADGDEF